MKNDDAKSAQVVVPREMWERRTDESERAYAAFSAFRDAEKRSLKSIASALNCSTQNVHWWSVRHNWRLRADAFDLEQDREQRAEFARRRVRSRDRHLQVAQGMLHVAAHALAEWKAMIAAGQALNLDPQVIALLTKTAVELENRTLGVDDEHMPTVINVQISELSDEGFEDACRNPTKRLAGTGRTMPIAEFERLQWESLTPEEQAAEAVWRDPPKKLN